MNSSSPIKNAIPLTARKDLKTHEATYLGERCWIVKDPIKLNYLRLSDEQLEILQLLDGQRNIDEILGLLSRKFPAQQWTKANTQKILLDLYQKGLVWSSRPGQGESMNYRGDKQNWEEIKQTLKNIFFIRLPGFDPTRILNTFYGIVKIVYHPAVVLLAAIVILYSWVFMIAHGAEIQQRLPPLESLFALECTFALWIIIGVTKVIHEFSHAFACRHSGGECHQIGIAFLVFSPCLYCDVSDSWLLRSRWHRIGIALAGIYAELLIASIAFFCWWHSQPGSLNLLCFLVFAVTTISTLLFNLNPLLRLDGYYVLCDLLGVPNLRQRADKALENSLLRFAFGISVEQEPLPARTNLYFVLYAVASSIYRTFLVFVICWILYSALKPFRLEYLGLSLGILAAILGIVSWCRRIHTSAKNHLSQNSQERKIKPVVFAGIMAGVVATSLFIPMPIPLKVPLHLEYADAQKVYANQQAQLSAVHIRAGQRVESGQVMIELFDYENSARLNRLQTQKKILETELRKFKLLVDAQNTLIVQKNLDSLEKEIVDIETSYRKWRIRSPLDGIIIEPAPRLETASTKTRLPSWHGTPLNSANTGCQIPKGTHLLTVAPAAVFEAVLRINQLDAHSVQIGQDVRIKLAHLPLKTYTGKIRRISNAPNNSSVGAESDHRDLLTAGDQSNQYLAIVRLDGEHEQFVQGVQGSARVKVEPESAAEWIWRNVKSTFNFQI